MWFRNLHLYPTKTAMINPDVLAEQLANRPLIACGAIERKRFGWVPVRGEDYVYRHGDHLLIAMGIEEKLLPAAVIKQAAEASIDHITREEGYRPGSKRRREIREQVEDDLLPRAFSKHSRILAWLDIAQGWLVVDVSSETKAYDLVKLLINTCPGLPINLVSTELASTNSMTNWLMSGEPPARFTIDRDGELRLPGADRSTVRYMHHALDGHEIGEHIAGGKHVTRLGMIWADRISFVLTEKMEIKRLHFLDILKEQSQEAEDAEAMFKTEIAIMTGELRNMIADLVSALGGLKKDLLG